ncbi:hypothetical protein QTI51_32075 [Variovorax sp. J22G73]|uniref:hypothetical protein n=1 Tax=unclassified Variovorax TaxID=663243 RepID=UPI002575153B|nr:MULTISPECIES: hypothetical protein [unclassified Variovorax]MDM0009446.1 hypothetical protein [Variovorax sp. J22R203]MDM0101953.1 hypothetical protein [Variovorax sp. J22G73]
MTSDGNFNELRVTTPSEVRGSTMLGVRVRAACQAPFAENSIGGVQDRIDRQFRYFEALGKFVMFADGAVFVGARVSSIVATTASICWKSAFYPGPRHRQAIQAGRGELLPLGFHGRFDLYLQQAEDMLGGAKASVVARSGLGEATTLDCKIGMPADVARALCDGMMRARLLAAGPP